MKTLKYIMLCALALFGVLGAPPAAAERSDAEFVEIVKDSVARILVQDEKGDLVSMGSGFLVSSWGVVMTNKHVMEDAHSGWCLFTFENEGKTEMHCYKISPDCFIYDNNRDVAMFSIKNDKLELPAPLFFCQKDPRAGDNVVSVGFPGISDSPEKQQLLGVLVDFCEQWRNNYIKEKGEEPDYTAINEAILQSRLKLSSQQCRILLDFAHTVTFGQVTTTRNFYSGQFGKVVQHSASIAGGNSGGPLIDRKTGFVVGMNTFARRESIEEVIGADGRRKGIAIGSSSNCALSFRECRKFMKEVGIPVIEGDPYRYLDTANAVRHLLGFSIDRDSKYAFETLKKTAGNKDSDAYSQFMLGLSYVFGNAKNGLIPINYDFGCDKDLNAGVDYLTRAAERGMPEAQFIVGLVYLSKDDESAHLIGKSWLKRSATQKFLPAQELLKELPKKD